MSSRRDKPTTTGRSHNERSNIYASKRIVCLRIEKAKTTLTLVTTFFKPLSSEDRLKLLMQMQLQSVVKLHVLILLALKTLYPNLSLKLHKCTYQNLLKPNGNVLILILSQYGVQTRQKYPRKIVFTPEVQQ